MKKIALIVSVMTFLIACGGGGSKNTKPASDNSGDLSQNPDYQAGLALIGKYDCLTCHKVDETLTCPPYREIANKYGSYPDTIISHLAGKIISGGTGVWGSIYMTPHANLSHEDAEKMVKYILLLKNK